MNNFTVKEETKVFQQESSIVVYYSTDYSRFRFISGNRELNEAKINRIKEDIQGGLDLLKYYPIQVVEGKENKLMVIDGQHRFRIARELKRPVFFIILDKKMDLYEIARVNSNVEKWRTKDFINCYIQMENDNYKKLQEFLDKYGLSPTISIKLLSFGHPGKEASGFSQTEEFQRGRFKVNFWDEATAIADWCYMFNEFPYWKNSNFIIALYQVMKAGKVTMDEFVNKILKNLDELKANSSVKEYVANLELIYNKGTQSRKLIV